MKRKFRWGDVFWPWGAIREARDIAEALSAEKGDLRAEIARKESSLQGFRQLMLHAHFRDKNGRVSKKGRVPMSLLEAIASDMPNAELGEMFRGTKD